MPHRSTPLTCSIAVPTFLTQVHDEKELRRVLQLEMLEDHLVGINNRSLETFEVDLGTTARLLSTSPGQEVPHVSLRPHLAKPSCFSS